MAKNAYIGVSGVARAVKQPYIGVSAVARKVAKGYIGVSGVARQFFQQGISILGVFTASSTVKGTPSYGYTISSDGTTMEVSMTSQRTTSSNYDTDRNIYRVSISGITSGDVVSFLGTNTYPKASQENGSVVCGGTTVKTWSDYGTDKEYSFTAQSTSDLVITVSDGDYNLSVDTVKFTMKNLTINGEIISFKN